MGSVTEDIRLKIHGLCRDYLGGQWSAVEPDQLSVKPVPDGNVNKLYFCCLPDDSDEEYKKVVVRLETDSEEVKNFRNGLHVTAMNVILSERGISPKLLAVFDGGMIHRMIECRFFMDNDDRVETRVKKLAVKLADFHSLRMPIPKARNRIFDTFFDDDNPFSNSMITAYNSGSVHQLIHELDLKTHKELNLFHEMKWLMEVITRLDSPVVFSHNDFNRKNILISKNSADDEIFLIDFDWTNYNYRGADIGRYFCSYAQSEPEFGFGRFPSDEEMSVFIDAYIRRMTEICGQNYAKQEINSRQRLVKEAKIFALNSYLGENFYFIYKTVSEPQKVSDNRMNMKTGEMRFGLYVELKEQVLRQYPDIKEANNN